MKKSFKKLSLFAFALITALIVALGLIALFAPSASAVRLVASAEETVESAAASTAYAEAASLSGLSLSGSSLLVANAPIYVKIGAIVLGALAVAVTIADIIIVCTENKKKARKAKPYQAAPAAPRAVEEAPVAPEPIVEAMQEAAPVAVETVEEVVEEQPVEEPVEEVVEEQPVEEPVEEVVEEQPADQSQMIAVLESGEVEESESGAIVHTAEGGYIYLMYNKSFKAKLIQAKDEAREYYNVIKNHALSYKKVSTRISWRHESVNRGRDKLARLVFRGKSLYLYLALNPEDYVDTKYKVESAEAKRFEELPCLYRIKNPRRVKYACELIDVIMERYGVEKTEKPEEDFISDYPYEETLPLIKRGLIKVSKSNRKIEIDRDIEEKIEENLVRTEVRVSEVKELMTDEEADSRVIQSTRKADKTKKGIINVDVLSNCFKNGETVTLEEIKNRVKNFDKKVTYVKVLARGALNKRLTVEADEFSVDAEKMILLMGGTVMKTESDT